MFIRKYVAVDLKKSKKKAFVRRDRNERFLYETERILIIRNVLLGEK